MRTTGRALMFKVLGPVALVGTATMAFGAGSLAAIPAGAAQSAVGASPHVTDSSSAAELQKLAAQAEKEAKATFKLTYLSTESGSTPQSVTFEQKPPEQLFKTATSDIIYTGKTTYVCSSGKCISYGSAGGSMLKGMLAIYSASTYVQIMQSWQTIVANAIPGFHISFSNATFAGQASQCVSWSYQGSSAKYCVTDGGVLAYVGGSGKSNDKGSFRLSYYSAHVSSSDFNVPKG